MTALTEDVTALLDGTNVGHLATVLPDGAPHSVPVWVDRDGDHVLFLTGPQSVKARNLAQDPRVALSITDRDNPFRAAYLRGHVAEVIEGEAAWAIVDRIAHKYIGGPYSREVGERVIFRIAVDRVTAPRFG
jgi:PPOX class probable F420-dependent enzyme